MAPPSAAPAPARRRPRAGRRAAGLLACGAALAAALPAAPAIDDLVVVSRGPGGGVVSGASPAISGDGRVVAFTSQAVALSGGSDGEAQQVYARDLGEGTTALVSRASGPRGAPADGGAGAPAVSGDGRFVAFASDAGNLAPADANQASDVFVRDLRLGTTTLISRAAGASSSAAGRSTAPSISSDGRRVAFVSTAGDLIAEGLPAQGVAQVYVRDRRAGTTTLVSRASGAGGAAGGAASSAPAISPDGRHVAFTSRAGNLTGERIDVPAAVFVRDLRGRTTTLVSRAEGAGGAPVGGTAASVSGGGRRVAFVAGIPTPPGAAPRLDVFVRDVRAGTTVAASRADGREAPRSIQPAAEPSISADGRYVAFSSTGDLSGESARGGIYVRDLLAGRTALVSRPSASSAAGASAPTTSAGGRYVAFVQGAVLRRDVLGPAPGRPVSPVAPGPVCAPARPPAEPDDRPPPRITLTRAQLLINQRIAQAAIRRLNAVQARLDAGLRARDLCGYAIGAAELDPAIVTRTAPRSLAAATAAAPARVVAAGGRRGAPAAVRPSVEQLLINQRIGQAAVRRANALARRLDGGLTGGDVLDGQIDQGILASLLEVVSSPEGPPPAPSRTVVPPRGNDPAPGSVTLSVGQLHINQRVFQAAVRRANALVRRLERGLGGGSFRDGSLTAADLAPDVLRPPA